MGITILALYASYDALNNLDDGVRPYQNQSAYDRIKKCALGFRQFLVASLSRYELEAGKKEEEGYDHIAQTHDEIYDFVKEAGDAGYAHRI